jgi:hypothetical protein
VLHSFPTRRSSDLFLILKRFFSENISLSDELIDFR